jgi:signal transduction histidine kinase
MRATNQPAPSTGGDHRADALHDLRERVKELTALHGAARILQDDSRPVVELFQDTLALVPPAWQYPAITCARIVFEEHDVRTRDFVESPWRQEATFRTTGGRSGCIQVYYREPRPPAGDGPFLIEETNLINSLSEMLRSFLERREAQSNLDATRAELERRVEERTAELRRLNESLEAEIAERRRSEERISNYRERLRSLAAELSLAEDLERRAIAADLHDRIGQTLAILKMKVMEIQRNVAFCGHEQTLEDMRALLDQAIRATRSLTAEISPPILADLGLVAAMQWLGEQFEHRHDLVVTVTSNVSEGLTDDIVALTLFKATREFLVNTAKHAKASRVDIRIERHEERISLSYFDNGVGFDPKVIDGLGSQTDAFGLFNVRERCEYLGGAARLESSLGLGVAFRLDLPARVAVRRERSNARARAARR